MKQLSIHLYAIRLIVISSLLAVSYIGIIALLNYLFGGVAIVIFGLIHIYYLIYLITKTSLQ